MWSATHPLGLSNTSSCADVIAHRRYPLGAAGDGRPAEVEVKTDQEHPPAMRLLRDWNHRHVEGELRRLRCPTLVAVAVSCWPGARPVWANAKPMSPPGNTDLSPRMAYSCYLCGMARVRISTTVDERLLADARAARSGVPDAALIDEALRALVSRQRSAEIDAAYAAAYGEHPLEEADAWGDLASFRAAADAS